MPYVLMMTPPGGAPEYWPEGFGFSAKAHALSLADAKRFESAADAMRAGTGYRWPPHFWAGEREHAQRMEAKFRNWRFETMEVGI